MDYPVTGLHHITGCSGGAQEDVDFFTQVVGQRLIKQTILFGGRYAHYHLSYANGKAEPGTVMTTFPYHKGKGTLEHPCGMRRDVECAATAAGGFARDEAFNQLGTHLLLPLGSRLGATRFWRCWIQFGFRDSTRPLPGRGSQRLVERKRRSCLLIAKYLWGKLGLGLESAKGLMLVQS
jgi:catechol 2,3-dioxygenase-like lactoylglutathione lyase family enzyme